MANLDADIAQLGTTPIAGPSPTGASARYEPEYETLQGEISKLEAVNGTPVDWRVAAEQGTAILKTKSKDLLVASFLCRALFENHGYDGLGAGLGILRDMAAQYWDSMFPDAKRPRARAAAATWLAERLEGPLTRQVPTPADRAAIEVCLANLEEFEKILDQHLEGQAPGFGNLRRALGAHRDSLGQAAAPPAAEAPTAPAAAPGEAGAAPAPVPAAPPAAAPAGASGAAAPDDIASDQDLQKAIRAGRDLLRKMALYQRGKNPASPSPYLLIRQAAWLGVEQGPPSRDGLTELREVAADRLAAFKALSEAGQHSELIDQVESSFLRAPFWLDGHRLTASALEALGHTEARAAVVDALAGFLHRFPALVDLRFANQAPFADDLTKLWIQDEVLGAGGQGEGAVPPAIGAAGSAVAAPDGATPWLEVGQEAQKLAVKGKIQKAMTLFLEGRRQAASARERFLWGLEQARVCQVAGRVDLALPSLESLDEEVTRFQLEEWEPGLSVEIGRMLLLCYGNQKGKEKSTPEREARIRALRARIVRLDILSAVEMPQN